MATWDTDLVLMTRVLVGDIDLPQTYTDEYIQRAIIASAYIVDVEVTFAFDYTYDIDALTISPDPVTSDDGVFIALVPLKAACIITMGEFKKALGQGIKVRDGDSAIDTSVSFRGYNDIIQFGVCASYDRLKWTLQASGGTASIPGKAVMGPHRAAGIIGINTISWYYDQIAANNRNTR